MILFWKLTYFAEFSGKPKWTRADEVIDVVYARSAILTGDVGTLVNVCNEFHVTMLTFLRKGFWILVN